MKVSGGIQCSGVIDGTSPWVADLDNEMDSISCDERGYVVSASDSVSTKLSLFYGSVSKEFDTPSVKRNGTAMTIGTASGGVTVSYNSNTQVLTVTYTSEAQISDKDDFTIIITGTDSGAPPRELHLTIKAVIGDVYNLLPANSEIHATRDSSGNYLVNGSSTVTLQCGYTKRDKNGNITTYPELTTTNPDKPMMIDDKYVIMYAKHIRGGSWEEWKSSGNVYYGRYVGPEGINKGGTVVYQPTLNINTYDAVEFIIVRNSWSATGHAPSARNLNPIDRETVWVVAEGEKGKGYKAVVYRNNFTESQWTTFGTIGHTETWGSTSGTRGECSSGDWFIVVGTATDTKYYHIATYKCDNNSGDLHGECINHQITKDGKDAFVGDITNEADLIGTDSGGVVQGDQTRTTKVHLWLGSTKQTLTANPTVSLTYASGGSVGTGVAVVTEASGNGTNEGTVKIIVKNGATLTDVIYADITVTCGTGLSKTLRFTLKPVKSGAPGVSPTLYQVKPTRTEISFARDSSNELTPSSISVGCGYTKNVNGVITPFAGDDDDNLYNIDGKYNIFFRYIKSDGTPTQNWNWLKDQSSYKLVIPNTTTYIACEFCISSSSSYATVGDGNILDRETVPIVKAGEKGDDAVIYSLVPSVSSVVKKKDGTYSVNTVSCTRQKNVGGTITDNTTDGTITCSLDGGGEQPYTNNVAINVSSFTKSIQFIYKIGTTVVARVTILLVADGEDGTSPWVANLNNQMDSISCDGYGYPVKAQSVYTTILSHEGSASKAFTVSSVVRKYGSNNASSKTLTVNSSSYDGGVKVAFNSTTNVLTVSYNTSAQITGKDIFVITIASGSDTRTLEFTVNAIEGDVYNLLPKDKEILCDVDLLSANLISDVSATQWQTTKDGNTIKTSGVNADTVFNIISKETITPGTKYVFGFYVNGWSGTGEWTWYASNNSSCMKLTINSNGWCWGYGALIPSSGSSGTTIAIDDSTRSSYPALTLSRFTLIKTNSLSFTVNRNNIFPLICGYVKRVDNSETKVEDFTGTRIDGKYDIFFCIHYRGGDWQRSGNKKYYSRYVSGESTINLNYVDAVEFVLVSYSATATEWTEQGQKVIDRQTVYVVENGQKGKGYKAVVYRNNFTESQWTTYGTTGRLETWGDTSGTRGDCSAGDWFIVVGTATDTGYYHVATYECDNNSGNLHGKCINHQITKDGKNQAKAMLYPSTVYFTGDDGKFVDNTQSYNVDFGLIVDGHECAVTAVSIGSTPSGASVTMSADSQKIVVRNTASDYGDIEGFVKITISGIYNGVSYSDVALLDIVVTQAGEQGIQGKTGRMYYIAGKFPDKAPYTRTNSLCPVVSYESEWWYLDADSATSSDEPSDSSKKWKKLDKFTVVLTEAIFVKEFAQFGSAIITRDWLISVHGTINGTSYGGSVESPVSVAQNGETRVSYAWFDPSYPNTSHLISSGKYNFLPNYAIDLKTGASYQNNSYVKGTINATILYKSYKRLEATAYGSDGSIRTSKGCSISNDGQLQTYSAEALLEDCGGVLPSVLVLYNKAYVQSASSRTVIDTILPPAKNWKGMEIKLVVQAIMNDTAKGRYYPTIRVRSYYGSSANTEKYGTIFGGTSTLNNIRGYTLEEYSVSPPSWSCSLISAYDDTYKWQWVILDTLNCLVNDGS